MRAVFGWLFFLLAPASALGAPITYLHSGGSASVELRLNGNVAASASALLDGASLSFDAAGAKITDLDLMLDDEIAFPRTLGYDTLLFTLQAVDAAGYASSGSGTNPFSITSGPLLVTFSGVFSDGLNGPPPPNLPFSGSLTTSNLPVSVTVAGNDLVAWVASSRMLQHGWQSLELWVGFTFQGSALPEPQTWMLLITGLSGPALVGRRRPR
jgi:hypothetical protein